MKTKNLKPLSSEKLTFLHLKMDKFELIQLTIYSSSCFLIEILDVCGMFSGALKKKKGGYVVLDKNLHTHHRYKLALGFIADAVII